MGTDSYLCNNDKNLIIIIKKKNTDILTHYEDRRSFWKTPGKPPTTTKSTAGV